MPRNRKILSTDQQIKKVKLSQEKARLRMLKAEAPEPRPRDALQRLIDREHGHAKRLYDYLKRLQEFEFMADELEYVTQSKYQQIRDFDARGFVKHLSTPGHYLDLRLLKLTDPPEELKRIERSRD